MYSLRAPLACKFPHERHAQVHLFLPSLGTVLFLPNCIPTELDHRVSHVVMMIQSTPALLLLSRLLYLITLTRRGKKLSDATKQQST